MDQIVSDVMTLVVMLMLITVCFRTGAFIRPMVGLVGICVLLLMLDQAFQALVGGFTHR
jgi:hypothetical protein